MSDQPKVAGRKARTQYSKVVPGPEEAEEGAALPAEPEAEPEEARAWLGRRSARPALLSGGVALLLLAGCLALRASLRRPLLPPASAAELPRARAAPDPVAMGDASKSLALYGNASKSLTLYGNSSKMWTPAGTKPKVQKPKVHKPPPVWKPPPMKLLINSHVKYHKPLEVLLQSMVTNASFDRWEDVMIVFGGDKAEVRPHWAYVGGHRVVVVNTTLNAYDYTALWAIWRYRLNHLVQADRYYYMLDSSGVGRSFTKLFKGWAEKDLAGAVLVRPWGYNSNLCILTRSLLYRFQGTYRHDFTKAEAVRLEIMERYNAHGAKPLTWWASHMEGARIIYTPPRKFTGGFTGYGTAFTRVAHWYPEFDVTHYMMANSFGDVTGQHQPVILPPLTPEELRVPP